MIEDINTNFFLSSLHYPSTLRPAKIMALFKKSPTSGASPKVNALFGSLCVCGSLLLGIYILVLTVYLPFLRLQDDGHILNITNTILLLCIHTVLLIMVVWSYLRVRFTNPGNIPRPHNLTLNELHALESGQLPMNLIYGPAQLATREFMACETSGNLKYCQTCQIYRPMRVSHCQQTGRCVAKFDHYCPLLSSAIGAGNYKFYIHFLAYTALLAIYLQVMAIFIVSGVQISALSIGLLVSSSLFADCILIPLNFMHGWMVLHNVTTRESTCCSSLCESSPQKKLMSVAVNVRHRHREEHGTQRITLAVELATKAWSRRYAENWTNVMGSRLWQWILPIRVSSDFDAKWWDQEFNEDTASNLRIRASQFLIEEELSRRGTKVEIPEKAYLKKEVEF